jgi:hypothetical protein
MGIGDLHRGGPFPRPDAQRSHATLAGCRLLIGNRGPLPKATDKLDLSDSGHVWGSSLGSPLKIPARRRAQGLFFESFCRCKSRVKTLIEAVEKTTDSDQLTTLAGALKAVPGKLDRQQLINLLKWPLSVGVLRSTLLDLLEQQTDKKFDGDLWKMVTWAQQNGIDVKSPPKRPDKSLTTQQERTTWGFLDLIPLSHSPPQPGPLLRLRANLQR